jgi:hypothetical protein
VHLNDTLKNYFLLFVFAVLAYWPLSFMVFSPKNDALTYFLPIRYAISESIYNGYLPFWSPYLEQGYPIHLDIQSGAWNPFVQLISLFGSYTVFTLGLETVLYVYISGIGMFSLLRHLNFSNRISLLFATAYMLCGFNTDSAQFLCWICGSAFLPLVYLFYDKTLTSNSWKQSILFAFFTYLFFTTAYPAEFILLLYFLLGYTLFYFSTNRKKVSRIEWVNKIKLVGLALIVFSLLSSPLILSYLTFLTDIGRGEGVSFMEAMKNSLHPLLLSSYFLPLPVYKATFISITNPLARNCYIGIIPAFFHLLSFFTPFKSSIVRFIKWTFVCSLLFALGQYGILRVIAYYTLPLMDTFRSPVVSKLFMNFSSCLLGAYSIQSLRGSSNFIRSKKITWIILISVIASTIIWGFLKSSSIINTLQLASSSQGLINQFKLIVENASFIDLIIFNLIIQLPFIYILYHFIFHNLSSQKLIIASICNCILHASLFQPFTVVRSDLSSVFQSKINSFKKEGFPIPDINRKITIETRKVINWNDGPYNLYSKDLTISENFLSPARLKSYDFYKKNTELRATINNYPLLYRADTLLYQYTALPSEYRIAIIDSLKKKETYVKGASYKATAIDFSPNKFELTIESNQPGYFCLQQNNSKFWELSIDGIKQNIETTNYTFIGFKIKSGRHHIQLEYKPMLITYSYIISTLIMLTITTLGIVTLTSKNKRNL